jgi:hypothetical protein
MIIGLQWWTRDCKLRSAAGSAGVYGVANLGKGLRERGRVDISESVLEYIMSMYSSSSSSIRIRGEGVKPGLVRKDDPYELADACLDSRDGRLCEYDTGACIMSGNVITMASDQDST